VFTRFVGERKTISLGVGDFVARILIAEDRETMRKALKALFLTQPHWEVCGEAEDGGEAIQKASQLQPDLIVMDFKMHDVNGLLAANEIFRSSPSVPIVLYTLYKNEELEATAKLVGIRRVVGKEEGAQTLLKAIEAELPMAQA
jgi:DNA-binding NarL/FixJ family response regulator